MKADNIVDESTWLEQRLALLEKEKALTRLSDEVARARRALGWKKIARDYQFESINGMVSLADLFGHHDQLIIQHFMFGPDADEGCPMCSFWADGYNPMLPHINARGTAFAAVSRAPASKLQAYQARMGWSFNWVSAGESEFNYDFGVSVSEADMAAGTTTYNYRESPTFSRDLHGTSVFSRDGNQIYHTYSAYGRGMDRMNAAYGYIDLLPKGRDEADLPFSMAWVRRHDSYD